MKLRSCGRLSAGLGSATCVAILLVSGCGKSTIDSGSTSSGSSTPAGTTVSTGAQMGLIWNSSDSTLRTLAGVPGATQLGAALFPAGTYSAGAFAGPTQTALLIDPRGNLKVMTLPSQQPVSLAGNVSPSSQIAFSPHGGYAVVFVPGSTSLLVVTGIPQSPAVATVTSAAQIQGAAVSDAGTLLVAANGASAGVIVTATTANGTRSTLATLAGFGGMSFVPGSEDALLADSSANTLARYHNGTATTLATGVNGLNQPFAVAASQDDHWAVTADRAGSSLLRVDLTGATAPAQSSCICSPTQLSALNGNAVFELVAPGTAPGWMIQADSPTSRVLFIPPVRSGQ
ncbi:MAG: YncE family protein [Terracidiphilus sp.]